MVEASRAPRPETGVRSADPGAMLRRVRRLARVNQRELALRAGVAHSVVSRIESGQARNPSLGTVDACVRAAGFVLEVAVEDDTGGRTVVVDHPFEGVRDVSGRRTPAHLEMHRVRGPYDHEPVAWWAWTYQWSTRPDTRIPTHTYRRRRGSYHQPMLDPATGNAVEPGSIFDWHLEQARLHRDLRELQPGVLWKRWQELGGSDQLNAAELVERQISAQMERRSRVARIGVFALQGDVREHARALEAAGCDAVPVRRPAELAEVDGLVLPGGESTTMIKLARTFELLEPLRRRIADGLPVYGSCAGMILLADRLDAGGSPLSETVGGLDITVRRNAFGRQVDSFEQDITVDGIPGEPVRAVFIRAPWVQQVGPAATPLGRTSDGHVVAVRQGPLLATSFHPEMTGDGRLHAYFCRMVAEAA